MFIAALFTIARTWSESVSCSVVFNSWQPHGLYSARLLCPWDSPGQNTGVGCHALLQIFLIHVSCTAGRFFTIWATKEALPGHGSNLNVHQWRKRQRSGSYIQWNITKPPKGTKLGHLQRCDKRRDCYTEWSKSEREKQILYINACMWNLEKWYRCSYLQSRSRDTDIENKCLDTNRKHGEGGIGRLGLTYIQYW